MTALCVSGGGADQCQHESDSYEASKQHCQFPSDHLSGCLNSDLDSFDLLASEVVQYVLRRSLRLATVSPGKLLKQIKGKTVRICRSEGKFSVASWRYGCVFLSRLRLRSAAAACRGHWCGRRGQKFDGALILQIRRVRSPCHGLAFVLFPGERQSQWRRG